MLVALAIGPSALAGLGSAQDAVEVARATTVSHCGMSEAGDEAVPAFPGAADCARASPPAKPPAAAPLSRTGFPWARQRVDGAGSHPFPAGARDGHRSDAGPVFLATRRLRV